MKRARLALAAFAAGSFVACAVPPEVPRAISPLASAALEIEPQLSVMRTYWPLRVVVPVEPEKTPAELV